MRERFNSLVLAHGDRQKKAMIRVSESLWLTTACFPAHEKTKQNKEMQQKKQKRQLRKSVWTTARVRNMSSQLELPSMFQPTG